jgi:hypothetical protein
MQGAPKKTSGRSHPWNAPLRATSSGICISTRRAVRKLLKTQAWDFGGVVGIALRRERFTSARDARNKWAERLVESRPPNFISNPTA